MNQQQITVRGCILCIGGGVKGESFINPNETAGQINHYLYPLTGSGTATNGETIISLEQGVLTDLKSLAGKNINYQVNKKSTWVAFNSLLPNRDMQVQITDSTPEQPYINETEETIFVVLKGNATINNNKLNLYQSGRLLKGKEASIKIERGAILALMVYGAL